eukprot:m.46444 g.46444  ORF g.46444 m.46444 type:complete len:106 (+) comp13151_c0_seq3:218-535(+)
MIADSPYHLTLSHERLWNGLQQDIMTYATIRPDWHAVTLLSRDATKPGVTVELSTSYTSSAKAGDSLRVEGKVLKMGRRLGFTQVEIFRSSDDALVATGRHTKAL